jgi:hypothetical protein
MRFFLSFLTIGTLAAYMLAAPVPAYAADDSAYEVKNVVVDITSKDAVNARNEAFAEAQTKAYRALVAKLRPGVAPTSVQMPDDVTLGRMVKDFEIASEHVASNRYRGNFIFRFDPAVVAPYLPADTSGTDTGTDTATGTDTLQDGAMPQDTAMAPHGDSMPHHPVTTDTESAYPAPAQNAYDAAYSPTTTPQPVTIFAYFQSLPELRKLQDRITSSGAVDDISVHSLSYGYAELRGMATGSMNTLQLQLGREGYSLQSQGQNRYQLRRG